MNETDPFYIDPAANEALAENPPTKAGEEEFIIESEPMEEPIPELAELKLGPDEEHGFALIEKATPKPTEQVLLFAEIGGLLRAATDQVIESSHRVAKTAKRKSGQFVLGSMIAMAWGTGGAKPAEAIDWKRHLPTAVGIGAQIGREVLANKAEQHARAAQFLAEAPQRVERLKDRIDDIDGRIVRAMEVLKDPKETKYRKGRVERDIDHMRLARAECIDELLWLQAQLRRAAAEGKTAQSEAQKARNNALGAQIADTIEREAAWSSIWGW